MPVLRRTSYVRVAHMDLSSGSREFQDIDDEEEKELEYRLKEMNWKQKVLYRIKNW